MIRKFHQRSLVRLHSHAKYVCFFDRCHGGRKVALGGAFHVVKSASIVPTLYQLELQSTMPVISRWAPCPLSMLVLIAQIARSSACTVFCAPVDVERGDRGENMFLVSGVVLCNVGNGWPKHFGRDCSPSDGGSLFCLWFIT